MLNENLLKRALPLAPALALIALTAVWGGYIAAEASGSAHWPFALFATSWPLLAWAGCHRCKRHQNDPASPYPHGEPVRERGTQFARLLER